MIKHFNDQLTGQPLINEEIDYCIHNVDKLPTLTLSNLYHQNSKSSYKTMIEDNQGHTEVVPFIDTVYLLSESDHKELSNLISILELQDNDFYHELFKKKLQYEWKDYVQTVAHIYNNCVVHEYVSNVFQQVYNKNN